MKKFVALALVLLLSTFSITYAAHPISDDSPTLDLPSKWLILDLYAGTPMTYIPSYVAVILEEDQADVIAVMDNTLMLSFTTDPFDDETLFSFQYIVDGAVYTWVAYEEDLHDDEFGRFEVATALLIKYWDDVNAVMLMDMDTLQTIIGSSVMDLDNDTMDKFLGRVFAEFYAY